MIVAGLHLLAFLAALQRRHRLVDAELADEPGSCATSA
jgi:hypothetical protein